MFPLQCSASTALMAHARVMSPSATLQKHRQGHRYDISTTESFPGHTKYIATALLNVQRMTQGRDRTGLGTEAVLCVVVVRSHLLNDLVCLELIVRVQLEDLADPLPVPKGLCVHQAGQRPRHPRLLTHTDLQAYTARARR